MHDVVHGEHVMIILTVYQPHALVTHIVASVIIMHHVVHHKIVRPTIVIWIHIDVLIHHVIPMYKMDWKPEWTVVVESALFAQQVSPLA